MQEVEIRPHEGNGFSFAPVQHFPQASSVRPHLVLLIISYVFEACVSVVTAQF